MELTLKCKYCKVNSMKYDPILAMELKFSEEETLAYQLVCAWQELTSKIIPNYNHTKIGKKGDLRKLLIFKHMLKYVREKKNDFKGFQYIVFMRAQIEICYKLQQEGKKILIDPSLLHGDRADARWHVWKKLVKQKRVESKAIYAYSETSLESEFNKTHKTIKDMLEGNITIENYVNHASDILKFVLLKRISPLYVLCSKWLEKLPSAIKNDIRDLSNLDNLKDFDTSNIIKTYSKYFEYECQ